jgi:hypothetical protein
MTIGITHAAYPDPAFPSAYGPIVTARYCNGLGTFTGADPSGDLNQDVPAGTAFPTPTLPPPTATAVPPVFASPIPCNHAREDLMAGDAANVTNTLEITAPDLNFSSVVTFAPPGTTITAFGAGLPAGTKVGGLHSVENLGLANGACNTQVSVDFVLYSVALPDMASAAAAGHPGDPRWATNIAYPRQTTDQTPGGDPHRFNGWTVGPHGTVTPLAGGTSPHIDPSGSPVNALGDADAIQNYPSYLLDVFAPTLGGTPIIPRAVYGGMTLVAGADWIPLYFVQFDSSDITALSALGGGLHISNTSEGSPSVSVLVDPSSPASPSSITDFCTGSSALGGSGCGTCGGLLSVTTMLLGKSPNGTRNINMVTTAADAEVTTTSTGFATGMKVVISGSNTTPSMDGARTITSTGAKTFKISPAFTTTAGCGQPTPVCTGTVQIAPAAISAISMAADAEVTTATSHGFYSGEPVLIAGSGSTPSLDGTRTVKVTSATTFKIIPPFVTTVAGGAAGTATAVAETRASNPPAAGTNAYGAACTATTTNTISAISLAADAEVTTTAPHGWVTGQVIMISGSNSTPSMDGTRTITVTSTTKFKITGGFTTTVAGTAGTASSVQCTKFLTTYLASLRDLDQDGIENELDTCPLAVNTSGDSRDSASQGTNGIDAVCTPGGASNDVDTDGFKNRQDNCPRVSNLSQKESEVFVTQADNGPEGDGMGDACDTVVVSSISSISLAADAEVTTTAPHGFSTGDTVVIAGSTSTPSMDGTRTITVTSTTKFKISPPFTTTVAGGAAGTATLGLASVIQNNTGAPAITIALSTTVANGRYFEKTIQIAKCFGATAAGGPDADADGYCAGTDAGAGAGGSESDTFQHKTWTQAMRTTLTGDSDRDGVSDGLETYLGTDPTHSCAQTGFQSTSVTKASDEGKMDNWPYDFNDDGQASLGDVLQYSSSLNNVPFGKVVSAAAGTSGVPIVRFDLNGNGIIDLGDVLQYSSGLNNVPFSKVCGPGSVKISAISVAASALITTATAHGYVTGDLVTIGNSNSTPSANGTWTVTVFSTTTFTIPLTTTVAGTNGCTSKTPQMGVINACQASGFGVATIVGPRSISSITLAADAEVTTSVPHGFTTGDSVLITGSTSTPSMDGLRKIVVTGLSTFKISPAFVTTGAGGAAGTAVSEVAGFIQQ